MNENENSSIRETTETDVPKQHEGHSHRKGKILGIVCAVVILCCLALAAAYYVSSTSGDDPQESPEMEVYTSASKASDTEEASDTDPADDSGEDSTEETSSHDWSITYVTVHHDAVTHTETVDPVYGEETSYHTVCNECGKTIDGVADQHIRETGHSGYTTNVPIVNEVVVTEGYTKEVTDTPAYDELVADKLVCTLCGKTQDLGETEAGL